MAVEQDEKPKDEGNVLELDEELKAPEPGEEDQPKPEGTDDETDVVVTFGEEAAPASDGDAPEWVRDLRKRNRELERQLAEASKAKAPDVPEVGPKPTLEDCGYDEERFEKDYNSWLDRKAAANRAKSEAEKASEDAQERYQAKVGTYAEQRKELGVKDFDEAEAEVTSAFSPAQQAILIHGAENKALLIYALGRNPAKLRELAKITDPIEFAFAAAKLEAKTKMERRPRTSPESEVRGSAPMTGQGDKTLERLEKEAEKPGADRSKLIQYKKAHNLL